MVFPTDEAELSRLLAVIAGGGLERALLGAGANLFADSQGYDGVVINITRLRRELTLDDGGLLVVGGGVDLGSAAAEAAWRGWCGVDFMGVIPGTIGAAVAINAGTNTEGCVADRLEWVETLTYSGQRRRYRADEMQFGYRTSRLLYGREIVTRAAFRLVSCSRRGVTPQDVLMRFAAVMETRRAKFPLDLPNFGSTFRSPPPPHPPAGKLIDDLGMKGLRVGGAQISPMHANFIVNVDRATSDDVLELMRRMHDAVLERYGVSLRPEVHYLCNRTRPRPDFFAAVA
jgi:UDP-N-acetylmuramate dehydrogenase